MIRLIAPDAARFDAWAACVRDFANGPIDGSGYAVGETPEPSREEFVHSLAMRLGEEDSAVPLAAGRVRCSNRWIVDEDWETGGVMLGFLAIRHRLNGFLLAQGGHIGYSVRPSARRRGIATAALVEALGVARVLGIDPVLVTCLEDNLASRRTIEHTGGTFENSVHGHRRYWFGTPPWPVAPDA